MLFRGFIVTDWFGNNEHQRKYKNINRIIVKESIYHYQRCCNNRNEIALSLKVKRDRTMSWLKNFISRNESSENKFLRSYVRNVPNKIFDMSTESIQSWIIRAQTIKKIQLRLK